MRKLLAFAAVTLFLPAISASAALLEGTVEKVDQGKKQILLQTDKGQETVEFSAATKGADKVKAGDRVKVKYTAKAGKNVADTIDASQSSAIPSAGERPIAPGGMKDAPPSGVR